MRWQYQRVRLPVSPKVCRSGTPGITVGIGATLVLVVDMVSVGKVLKSSGTIMVDQEREYLEL